MLSLVELTDPQVLIDREWCLWTADDDPDLPVFGGGKLYLCPARDFENVPNGTLMTNILGDQAIKGEDTIDDDTRGGFLAYGVLIMPRIKQPVEQLDWTVDLEKLLPGALQPQKPVVE